MRIQDHLGKITWTMLDKVLFMAYGLIRLYQVSMMTPSEFGLFALLDAIIISISTLTDSFALNGIVKYGSKLQERAKFNALIALSHVGLSGILCLSIYLAGNEIARLFDEQLLVHVAEYVPILMVLTIPRLFFIKFLLRETQMRSVFIANGAWFFTMIGLTIYLGMQKGELSLSDMVYISGAGTTIGSLAGGLLAFRFIEFAKPTMSVFRDFIRFGAFQVAWNIPATIMRHLDVYIVQYFFGTAIVGIFQSAKTLYRFFEALIDGISGLYYPALVRMHARGDRNAEHAMTSKIISFTMFAMTGIVIIFQMGIGEWLVISAFFSPDAHRDHFANDDHRNHLHYKRSHESSSGKCRDKLLDRHHCFHIYRNEWSFRVDCTRNNELYFYFFFDWNHLCDKTRNFLSNGFFQSNS